MHSQLLERRLSDEGSEARKELKFWYKRQRPNRFKDISQLYPCSAETSPASSNTCVEKWHYWPMYGIFQAKCYTGFHHSCLDRIFETGKSFWKPVFAHKHITLPSKETLTVRYIKNCTCEEAVLILTLIEVNHYLFHGLMQYLHNVEYFTVHEIAHVPYLRVSCWRNRKWTSEISDQNKECINTVRSTFHRVLCFYMNIHTFLFKILKF